MKNIPLCLVALACALPAAAQTSGAEADFARAVEAPISKIAGQVSSDMPRQKAATASAPAKPQSCDPAPELEMSFELTVPGVSEPIELAYKGCDEADRNDYLAGYTDRYYEGNSQYGLVLVTNHADGAPDGGGADAEQSTQILISKGKDWAGDLGTSANTLIVSGAPISQKGFTVRAKSPALSACEAALPKPVYGDNQLWMITKTAAYYYREDCDICAELDSCDLATGRVKSEIVAHSVSCSDLDAYKKGSDVVYDGCPR